MPNAQFGFQFHYGTIKRKHDSLYLSTVSTFQFHYGTIKSKDKILVSPIIYYFNSTMVRLKEFINRIEANKNEFQFHYGTIKSPKA